MGKFYWAQDVLVPEVSRPTSQSPYDPLTAEHKLNNIRFISS